MSPPSYQTAPPCTTSLEQRVLLRRGAIQPALFLFAGEAACAALIPATLDGRDDRCAARRFAARASSSCSSFSICGAVWPIIRASCSPSMPSIAVAIFLASATTAASASGGAIAAIVMSTAAAIVTGPGPSASSGTA